MGLLSRLVREVREVIAARRHPARTRVAAIATELIASATPGELDQLAATLDDIRKARAK